MKDVRAVARQWFSVPTRCDAPPPATARVRVLETRRATRKLRRGELEGNRFRIRLRGVASLDRPPPEAVPNYFGPQRFGRDNLASALGWLDARRWEPGCAEAARTRRVRAARREDPFRKGLYLSVLRAFLFNEVLARRVRAGNFDRVLEGDVAQDGLPMGPLWGRGRSATRGCASAFEAEALAEHARLCAGLEYAGPVQGRRLFVLKPRALSWCSSADGSDPFVALDFVLPAGSYATVLLAELVEPCEAGRG
jgi:tRNA pseudouridine13 synthase